MAWLKNDDRFPEHRKIRRLTDAAYRLHHTALCACAKDETDGRVTEADIADMEHGRRLRKHVQALVDAELWHVVKNGWEINDFLDYNQSHRELEAKRAKDRQRQTEWRRKRWGTDEEENVSQRDNSVTNALVTPSVTTYVTNPLPVPSLPVPSRPNSSGQVGGGSNQSDANDSQAPPIQRCGEQHPSAQACSRCGDLRKADKQAEADKAKTKANRQRELTNADWEKDKRDRGIA